LKKSLTASLSYRLQQEHLHVVVRVSCGSLCSEEHDKIRSQVGYERTSGLLVSLRVRVKQEWMVPFSYNLSKSIISYMKLIYIYLINFCFNPLQNYIPFSPFHHPLWYNLPQNLILLHVESKHFIIQGFEQFLYLVQQ